MKNVIRWGLAAGLAAALGLFFDAQAQSSTGTGSSGASGASGSGGRGDTGGPTPTGQDRSTATSETTPQGGAAGTSSDSGQRSGSAGSSTGSTGAGGTATGSDPSGRQASGRMAGQGKIDKGLQERLERIHALNQAEVQLGQLGAQSALSPEVKQFAESMHTDHQKADDKLTQTAQTAGVASLEGKTFQKESDKARKDMEKLQSKQGSDFDKEFMSRMVKDHENALKEVEKASKDAKKANQTELAAFLDQTHTGMKGHLEHAKQVQKSLADSGTQRQGRRPPGATGGTGASSPSERGMGAGGRGDTGGPTPTGQDRSSAGSETTPQGGAAGTSSDSGQRTK